MDVYQLRAGSQTPTQIHDFNPSTFPPLGLFWTVQLPEDSVEIQLGKGSATLQGSDVPVFDYGTLVNALFGPPPSPLPTGTVSFTVVWSGVGQRVNIRNTDPTYGGFAGEFIRTQRKWNGPPRWVITGSLPIRWRHRPARSPKSATNGTALSTRWVRRPSVRAPVQASLLRTRSYREGGYANVT